MIDRSHDLPLSRQAKALGISRGSVYYLPRAVPAADLALMRRIDELHLELPVRGQPDAAGHADWRKARGRAPARRDADEADGDRGDLSPAEHLEAGAGAQDLPLSAAQPGGDAAQPGLGDGHHLRADGAGLRLSRRRRRLVQPQGPGLAAVDHAGRRTSASRPGGGLARHGKPEIFNTDQGSSSPVAEFTGLLIGAGIAISMDGKGAWR